MIALPGLTPRSPPRVLGPVSVTVETPRTAKLLAVPSTGRPELNADREGADAGRVPFPHAVEARTASEAMSGRKQGDRASALSGDRRSGSFFPGFVRRVGSCRRILPRSGCCLVGRTGVRRLAFLAAECCSAGRSGVRHHTASGRANWRALEGKEGTVVVTAQARAERETNARRNTGPTQTGSRP